MAGRWLRCTARVMRVEPAGVELGFGIGCLIEDFNLLVSPD